MIVLVVIVIAVALSAAILSLCAKQNKKEQGDKSVGSIIVVEGHRLQVVEAEDCFGCYLFNYCKNNSFDKSIDLVGSCMSDARRDNKSVKFVEMR